MRPLSFAPTLIIALGVAFAAYVGAYSAATTVLAHGTHCDSTAPYTFVPCNRDGVPGLLPRYYAGETGNPAYAAGKSNGIRGFISAENVAIADTSSDFIANFIGITHPNLDCSQLDNPSCQWVQLGFDDGVRPSGGSSNSVKVYTEVKSTCPLWGSNGYSFTLHSTPSGNPRYNEYFEASYKGSFGWCSGEKVYFYNFNRGISFGTFDFGITTFTLGRFDATTELRDWHAMEPSETQCFGGGYQCTPSQYGHDLVLWNNSTGYYSFWDTSRPTIITEDQSVQGWTSDYFHNPNQYYYRFTTTSPW